MRLLALIYAGMALADIAGERQVEADTVDNVAEPVAELVDQGVAAAAAVELPEALTLEDFDQVTSNQLTFVEFYSPFCLHCKELAPTWEKTYKEFHPELQKLNVQMRQVNCVASGDLCEREEVFGYPNLRIYSPIHDRKSGEKTGKLKFVTSYPRSLVRTAENLQKFVKNAVAEYDAGSIDLPSSSKELDLDNLLKFIAGDIEQPEFVIFYSGTEEQWKITEETGKSAFSKTCYDCLSNKQTWDKLSNQVLTTIGTNHFSCTANAAFCERMGFDRLPYSNRNPEPKFAMFLPKKAGITRFDFKGIVSLENLKKFATDLYENSLYDNVSAKTLSEIMEFRKSLPFEPLQSYYPLQNKVAFVFYHDPKTTTDEDKAILPYLLEFATYSPFNIYIYTAKSDKFERAINTQAMNMAEFISYDKAQEKYKFNKALHLATSLTTKPTLFAIKDNTLFTSVFQSFAPEDLRNEDKITEFLTKNQYPLYQELTPGLVKHYFDDKPATKNDKIVVNFVDSSNAKKLDETLFQISLAAHEYHHNKNEYYFNDILSQREAKKEKVEQLKQQNADSVKIIREMRKEIPHLFDNNQVLFTFIDVANNPELASDLGWNINKKSYKEGDAIVVTKDNSLYWDSNLSGEPLTSDPKQMRSVLRYLLDPALVKTEKVRFRPLLVGSPYPAALRFMDAVHQRGFLGYLMLIAGTVLVVNVIKRIRKPRAAQGSQGQGILGGKSD